MYVYVYAIGGRSGEANERTYLQTTLNINADVVEVFEIHGSTDVVRCILKDDRRVPFTSLKCLDDSWCVIGPVLGGRDCAGFGEHRGQGQQYKEEGSHHDIDRKVLPKIR